LRTWRHRKRPVWIHACLVILALVGASALFATRSRSALVACTLGVAWMWLRRSPSTTTRSRQGESLVAPVAVSSTRWLTASIVAFCIGGLIFLGLMFWGDDEWMSAAPASLEFRLQYWKSTVALLVDHPLMGAGPGGFRSMYLQYRLPVANETIADPHNFFFETLAAGGVVAGFLLILLIAVCIRAGQKTRHEALLEDSATADRDSNSIAPWIGYGAGISLTLVWLFASLSGRLPDFEAAIFAVPIAIAAGWFIHSEFLHSKMVGNTQSESRLICSANCLSRARRWASSTRSCRWRRSSRLSLAGS
jgi:O-antigen ligase